MRGENHAAGSAELIYMPVVFHESLPLPASAWGLACVMGIGSSVWGGSVDW
jgi:hypothetical protein